MTKLDVPISFELVFSKIKEYIEEKDMLNLIEKAYLKSDEIHKDEKRLSGDDAITHYLHVAYILSTIKADYETICAAFLYDSIEYNLLTEEDIRKVFGEVILSLILGVTTINKLNFSADNEAMIANHRKILVGLSEDVRVIIIKLAERLHNMQTLWVLDAKTQKEKAREALDILVPIAHRLGMNHIKGELEDLSLRYLKPDVYFGIVEKLNATKKERDNNVLLMQESISKILNDHSIAHKIKGRSKSIYSIYNKLDKGKTFNEIYDLLALRIYVDSEEQCYQTLGLIHSKYKPIPKRFKDYIAMPKTNMYQSLHTTVFGVNEQLFEIQIRTYNMDLVAENGIASHWSYKENSKTSMQSAMEAKLQFFKTLMEIKNSPLSDEEFMNKVHSDVLDDNIYVFTPKGDVIELPKGSTPIDFAYKVHSGVGDKMVGALVNNAIVPLDYELKDNDIIKINTNKNQNGPSREWINMAKTYQAKNKIKSYFNKLDKEEYLKKGEDLLNKEVKKKKIPISEFFSNDNISKLIENYKVQDLNELYIDLGNGKYNATQIINFLYNENDSKEDLILKRTAKPIKETTIKGDILVEGTTDIKINLASCCRPIYKDPIVGYVTKGYGVTVHRSVCPNIKDTSERIIDVYWNENNTNKKYPASLLVTSTENKKVLLDIIAKTSNNDITIQSINTINTLNDEYHFEIVVQVASFEKINKYMNDISSIKHIIAVERLIK